MSSFTMHCNTYTQPTQSTVGRSFAKSAGRRSEYSVNIFRGNHTLYTEGYESHAMRQSTKRGYYRENAAGCKHNVKIAAEETIVGNNPVTLRDVVKENQLKDAEKKPVESPASRCVGIEYIAAETRTVGDQALRVGDKITETMGIEGDHCQEAVAMNTASVHALVEGQITVVEEITVEKQGEVAKIINGSGDGHASIQVFRVGGLALLRGRDLKRNKPVESLCRN